MITELFDYLGNALYGNYLMATAASFLWGVLSIVLSPCHLSGIPLVIGFIGSQGKISFKRTFSLALLFSLGILITIALIGVITASMGKLMGDTGSTGNYLVAAVFFVFGLYLLGIINLPWDYSAPGRFTSLKGYGAAILLGLIFGVGLGPCTFAFMAPVLGVVFQTSGDDILLASALLGAFAAGHCMVIIAAGTLHFTVQRFLNWSGSNNYMLYLRKVCGLLVIAGGFYIIYLTL